MSVRVNILKLIAILGLLSFPASSLAKSEINYRQGSFNRQLLYDVYTESKSQNTLVSPFALRTALTTALMGTNGETADEIEQALRQYNNGEADIPDKYKTMLSKYKSKTDFKMANVICLNHKFRLKESFLQLLSDKFYSTPLLVDFALPNQAVNAMNRAVEKHTDFTIRNMVERSNLGYNPEALLLSAAAYNGDFALPIPAEGMQEKPFRVSPTSRVDIPMMKYKGKFDYALLTKDLLSTAIRIPYKDSDLSLIVIKPADNVALKRFMRIFHEIDFDLRSLKRKFSETEGYVIMPKFKTEFQVDLKYFLNKMGMTKFFTTARFDEMIQQNQAIHFADVIHKTSIEVKESVATAVPYNFAKRLHPQFEIFEADRPFYYAVVNSNFEPLFEGTFAGMST
ncbi:antitrypsin-like precursor [Musca domestica]|uniref:Antitrypsin-like precursor n=1 Tax=Musca domestica TaxID=7370 RepID=A0A077CX31_MUSDO|nr:antitrypsin-like precursor [Musca domestica]AIL24691.1 serine protease inhibitor 2 [Musca domestica]